MGGSGVLGQLLGGLANKAHEKSTEERAKLEQQTNDRREMYKSAMSAALTKGDMGAAQAAADEIEKLDKLPKGKSPISRFMDFAGKLHKHVNSGGKQDGAETAGVQQAPPVDSAISGAPAGGGGDNKPAGQPPTAPDAQPSPQPGHALATKKLTKLEHGLGAGLTALGGVFKTEQPTLPPLNVGAMGGMKSLTPLETAQRDEPAEEYKAEHKASREEKILEQQTQQDIDAVEAAGEKLTPAQKRDIIERRRGLIKGATRSGPRNIPGNTLPPGTTDVFGNPVSPELKYSAGEVGGVEGYVPEYTAPTTTSTTGVSNYDANTGTTTTSRTTKKTGGSAGTGAGAGATGGTGTGKAGGSAKRSLTPLPAGRGDSSAKDAPKGGRIAVMGEDWARNGVVPAAKDRPAVEQWMAANGKQPGVKPTQPEIKLRDDIKKVAPMVDNLQDFLEDNKLTKEGEGGLWSIGAWRERGKVEKAWQEYTHGLPPKDKQLGKLIKFAAAIKIMGAAPWMSIGRGKYLYSEIVQHLPEPTDTPAQLYEKVKFYRDILEDAKNSLPDSLKESQGKGDDNTLYFTRDPNTHELVRQLTPPQAQTRTAVVDQLFVFPADATGEEIQKTLSKHSKPTASMEAKPSLATGKGIWRGLYNLEEKGVQQLPVLGSMAGGTAGLELGGPAGAVIGAGAGAGLGASAQQVLERGLFKKKLTPLESAEDIGTQTVIGAASEDAGQAASKAIKPTISFFERTAARGTRIPLTPGEAGLGGPANRTVEGFLQHALPSKGIMEAFRERQLTRAGEVVSEEIARIGNHSGTPEEMGKVIQKGLEDSRTALKKEVRAAYKPIDDLTAAQYQNVKVAKEVPSSLVDEGGQPMSYTKTSREKQLVGGVLPETAPLKREAIGILRRLKEQEKVMDPKLLADSRSILEGVIHSPKHVPYSAMADTRSDLLAIGRKLDEVLPGKRAGIAKTLSELADTSMMDAATNSGISGLPEQIRIANGLSKEMHRKFEQELLTKVLETGKPEMIAGYVRGAGLQELRDMNTLLSPANKRVMQAKVLGDVFADSMDKATGKINPMQFVREVNGMGEERARTIFGPNYDSVKQLSDLLGRLKPPGFAGSGGASLHNWAYIRALPVAGTAILLGHPVSGSLGLAAIGTEAMFLRKMASAITNPAKTARMFHYLELGMKGAPYATYGLARLVSDEPDEQQFSTGEVQGAGPHKAVVSAGKRGLTPLE